MTHKSRKLLILKENSVGHAKTHTRKLLILKDFFFAPMVHR